MKQKEGRKSTNKIKFFYNCNNNSFPDESYTHPGFYELAIKTQKKG
jgi:hypothetical protein